MSPEERELLFELVTNRPDPSLFIDAPIQDHSRTLYTAKEEKSTVRRTLKIFV